MIDKDSALFKFELDRQNGYLTEEINTTIQTIKNNRKRQ